jgi:hypothetical protein
VGRPAPAELTPPNLDPDAAPPEPSEDDFPEATSWEAAMAAGDPTDARPVVVRPAEGRRAGAGSSAQVEVEVFDRAVAEQAGASGFVFRIDGAGGHLRIPAGRKGVPRS